MQFRRKEGVNSGPRFRDEGTPRYLVIRRCGCGNPLAPSRRIDLCRACAFKARVEATTRRCGCGAVLEKGKQLCANCRPPVVRLCRCGAELATRRRYCDACVREIQRMEHMRPPAKSPEWIESELFEEVRAMGGPGGMRSSLADGVGLFMRLWRVPMLKVDDD